jgi:hypothetical protein
VRYDVDGSIIENTLHDKKVWNLREIVRPRAISYSFLQYKSSCLLKV